jgi:hypothetical protein
MKIGILTFHNANNYGALLQAYALQETLKNFGYSIEIINIPHVFLESRSKLIRIQNESLSRFFKSLLSTIFFLPKRICNNFLYSNFRKKYLCLSKKYQNKSKMPYDIYIVGSDQIWNLRMTNFNSDFFLCFCNRKKIAYAASIGVDFLTKDEESFFKKNIGNIDRISVRETVSKELLSKFTNNKIWHVLDPTMLVYSSIWDKFIISKKNKNYLLVYSVGPINNLFSIVDAIKNKYKIDVYLIAPLKKKGYKTINFVSPVKFISLIYSSSMVITNSFHGTIFSIIFKKKFITIPHSDTGSRVTDLLKNLCLEDRIVKNENEAIKKISSPIDYEKTKTIIQEKKDESLKFLFDSIKGNYETT